MKKKKQSILSNAVIKVPKRRVSKTLYEKKRGKYIPVGKDDFILPYGFGDYLVRVMKGSHRVIWCKKPIRVNYADIEILMDEVVECLTTAIMRVSELQPRNTPFTDKEKKGWEAYRRIAGSEGLTFSRGSAWEMALKASEILRDRLRDRRTNGEGVKECPKGCLDIWAEKGAIL